MCVVVHHAQSVQRSERENERKEEDTQNTILSANKIPCFTSTSVEKVYSFGRLKLKNEGTKERTKKTQDNRTTSVLIFRM